MTISVPLVVVGSNTLDVQFDRFVGAAGTTNRALDAGLFAYAFGIAALGTQIPLVADFVFGLEPVPKWLPLQLPLAYLSAAILLGASAMIASGWRRRLAAVALAAMFLAWFVLLQLPLLATHSSDGTAWTRAFEVLAMFASAWLVAAHAKNAGPSLPAAWSRMVDAGAQWAPQCFGACLLVFGTLHFVFHDYVAYVIPAWIPAHPFFAYFTGAAHFAAGVALVTRVQARLAATLLGVMFGSWVLLLHIPRVAAEPSDRNEWTSLLIAITLCGGAWLLAGYAPNASAKLRKQ